MKCMDTVTVTVIGLQVTPHPVAVCFDQTRGVSAVGTPAGGAFSWTSSNKAVVAIEGSTTGSSVRLKGIKAGQAALIVTYTVGGKACGALAPVSVVQVNIQPYPICLSAGKTQVIKSVVTPPGGTFAW